MYKLPYPKVTRRFHPDGGRYRCQFRQRGQKDFITDCAFGDIDVAMSFVSLAVRFLAQITEGQVLDEKEKQVVFTCQTLVPIESDQASRMREVPAEYAQLTMKGFDFHSTHKGKSVEKRKVEETLARLRQLHEELNSQLYTRPTERPAIHTPSDAADILQCFIGNLDHEELWVIDLDTRNRVMRLVELYKGSVNSSQVRIAEVFRQAMMDNSPAIIVAHNHPSGDPTPSPDDVAVTRGIVQAGKLLDIDVLDHLVIGQGRFVSLKERGLGF